MGKVKFLMLAAAAALLGACSGSDNTLYGDAGTGGTPGGGTTPSVASLSLLTSSPQLPSDGSADVTITALVRDTNNNVMEDVNVVFNADSGSLVVTQPSTTGPDGTVSATLSLGGDPSLRDITVTALADGTAQATTTVAVTGLTITIDGPTSLSSGAQGTYTVRVIDDPVGGSGIAGADVTVEASGGSAIATASTATDSSGELEFTLTAGSGTSETLTASALGAFSTPYDVAITTDSFAFTFPDPSLPPVEINLGAEYQIDVLWQQGAGMPITFSTSRGSFTDCAGTPVANNTLNADGTGAASICVTANNAGPAVVTATNSVTNSIQLDIEFVATTPTAMDMQANPFTLATNAQSTITAVVRDAAGNLVKNKVVVFTLDDVTGGSLTVAQATTNSQGRAQTVYRSSTTTSSVDGVHITAAVQGFPAVVDAVDLTVAQRELFISIGTGNEIDEPNTAQYRKEWIIQVTDAQGNGVADADVTFSVLSQRYWDGTRTFPLGGSFWVTNAQPAAGCIDEDALTLNPNYDRNGVLDPGEDNNGNGKIEAGNIASASAQVGGGGTLTTDANGFGIIDVYWPQEYAYWLEATLEARTSVQGTEFSESTTFLLDGSASDFNSEDTAPPGVVSPFGTDGDCSSPPPPDGP